jgi:glycosyltransferase involved in cell wall biosynthesis
MPAAQSSRLFAWLNSPVSVLIALRIIFSGIIAGWRNKQHSAGHILFNTSHSGLENKTYPAMLRKMRVKSVFIIHDLIPITYPEYSREGEAEKHRLRMKHLLDSAAGIIANSQVTLNDLSQFAEGLNRPMPPSTVGLLAPGMLETQVSDRPMSKPYFVILSTIEPRKNHVMVLQVWRRLIEKLGDSAPHLMVIGQRGWECENVVDILERCTALKAFVTELNSCSDEDLVTYLHYSQALLFPSFAEGYGMPLVEALALGVPVIASDLPVFREIAADIPDYVDPLDGKRWSELIAEYTLTNSKHRTAQLSRIESFKTPCWTDHFAQVDAMLTQLGSSEK